MKNRVSLKKVIARRQFSRATKQCKLSFPWTPMSFPRRRESKIPAFAGMT
ncbi:hypothetical protein [Candidatus Tisiphia endosymbiont of Hybos culiciformis]